MSDTVHQYEIQINDFSEGFFAFFNHTLFMGFFPIKFFHTTMRIILK